MFRFNNNILLSFIILFTVSFSVSSQDYLWSDITEGHTIRSDDAEALLETGDGYIWIGTNFSGLWVYDGYNLKNIDPAWYGLPIASFKSICSLYETPGNNIWIGTNYHGVTILNPIKAVAHKLEPAETIVDSALKRVHDFYLDKEDVMWMATHLGLVRYDMEKQEFALFQTDLPPYTHDKLSPSVFRCILPDPNDPSILWIGGVNGLFSFNMNTQLLRQHRHPEELIVDYGIQTYNPLHKQHLMTKMKIVDNSIYLSAWGGGIMQYSITDSTWKKHIFQPYSTMKVSNENLAHSMVEHNGKIFFGAVPKIGFLNLNDHSSHIVDESVNKNRKNFFAGLKDKNNVLWWSTFGNGIHTMKIPDKEHKPSGTSNLVINSISFDDKEIYTSHKEKPIDTISVLPGHNHISVNVSLLNPIDTANVEYQYQLSDYDHGWISNGISRNIDYFGLAEGNYNLKIRARETGGEWKFAHVPSIYREVHFYRSSWFIALIFVLVAAAIYFLYKFRVGAIKKKAKVQQQMTELKLQALQSQMNQHFIFNALNSINSFILTNNTQKASKFLTKFSRLIRQALNISKENIIPLEEEIKTLMLYLEMEKLRFMDKFDFEINISPSIDQKSTCLLPLTMQPYIENAIWHGLMHKTSKGKLWIDISKTHEHICFEIKDNGIGRENSKKYRSKFRGNEKSIGMSISKNRLDILNEMYNLEAEITVEDLYADEEENPGTKVVIKIPEINNDTIVNLVGK